MRLKVEIETRRSIVGEFLKEAREAAGLTQHDVAKKLSYTSPQFVSNWERGLSLPPLDAFPKLVSLLNVSASHMLDTLYRYQDEVLQRERQELARIFKKRKA